MNFLITCAVSLRVRPVDTVEVQSKMKCVEQPGIMVRRKAPHQPSHRAHLVSASIPVGNPQPILMGLSTCATGLALQEAEAQQAWRQE